MITATTENDTLEITGKMNVGDKINGLCCDGFDWECSVVVVSAWGACNNPDCKAGVYAEDDTYRSVTNWDDEEIALFLLGE